MPTRLRVDLAGYNVIKMGVTRNYYLYKIMIKSSV